VLVSGGWLGVTWSPASAFNLALFRISVAAMVLLQPELRTAEAWAGLPRSLLVAPEGLHWFVAYVPINPTLAAVVRLVLVVAALLALVGWWARLACLGVLLAGFYVFALAQLAGSVVHNMHLLWFAALLAASPCGDAISVDAWRAGRLTAPEGPRYGFPIDVACCLLGVIYFFPGFWKLATSGIEWFWSDNLRNQMYWKWFQNGWLPPVRIDRWPFLCRLGGLAVVAFEVSFVGLVLRRRLRPVAAGLGLVFHLATELFLKIPFFGLWGLYLVLIDGRRVATWAGWKIATTGPDSAPPGRLVRGVAVLLLVGATVQGARGAVQAWPLGCYPTFAWTVGSEMPDLALEAVQADGRAVEILLGPRRPALWALTWQVSGAYGRAPRPEALADFWKLVRHDPRVQPQGAVTVRFYRVSRSVIPERWNQPARREALVGEITR
jgi:hypothetical protein